MELTVKSGSLSTLCSLVSPQPAIVNHYNGVILSRIRKLVRTRLDHAGDLPVGATAWPIHHWLYQKLRRSDCKLSRLERARIKAALREAVCAPEDAEVGVLASPGQDLWLDESLQAVSKGLAPQEGHVPLNIDRSFPGVENRRPTGALSRALELVHEGWPDGAREFYSAVRDIIPVAESSLRSASVPLSYGAVFLTRVECWTECDYFEHLVHEAGHHALFARQSLIDLGTPAPASIVSPLRQDSRPPMAVLHAAFVCARVAMAAAACLSITSERRNRLAEIAVRNHADLQNALVSLEPITGWTVTGAALIRNLRSVANRIAGSATHCATAPHFSN